MWIADDWKDYELLDAGDGEKLERWGKYILRRPDPCVVWPSPNKNRWQSDGHFHRSTKGGGHWEFSRQIPSHWNISYKQLTFKITPMGFKHTGLFPEQAVNWNWLHQQINNSKVLNLFAYTGAATAAAALAGADVVHVDSAKAMTAMAKQNLRISGLEEKFVRYIVDDVLKFVKREQRRSNYYDGIIMDPPAYGRGPDGEMFKIEFELYNLIEQCMKILSPNPAFFLINSYSSNISCATLKNIYELTLLKKYGGQVQCDELGLPVTQSGLVLPCGISGRWQR